MATANILPAQAHVVIANMVSRLPRADVDALLLGMLTGIAVVELRNGAASAPVPFGAPDIHIRTVKPRKARKAKAVAKAVSEALTPAGKKAGATGRSGLPKATKAPKAKAVKAAGSKGQKRDPEKLAALTDELLVHIKANPNQRIEQIGKSMLVSTKELALPARKLIADGFVVKSGNKRSTTYAAKGGKVKSANGVAVAAE
jgi:hypothetical protein